jgi:hypothetical protein
MKTAEPESGDLLGVTSELSAGNISGTHAA